MAARSLNMDDFTPTSCLSNTVPATFSATQQEHDISAMNRPQPPSNILLLLGGAGALAAAAVYAMSPPSKVSNAVGKEDTTAATGHREEGVQRQDANPTAQKADVREKAL
ncbi:hypothetical protein FKP32DRAFT_508512 [Trametes sanguinea]|nr:hypothetical protein FKP32DRAFT_508512 [Trametes sanguinea]